MDAELTLEEAIAEFHPNPTSALEEPLTNYQTRTAARNYPIDISAWSDR